jgi:signal transduction histidine kinase
MAERFVTPKTSLRDAINNAAGPIALSNRVLLQFAPLSFALIIGSSPARLSGTILEWFLVATAGYLVTVFVLLGFRATVLPATPGRRPKILLTSVAYLVAGLARGLVVYLTGAALGIMPEAELWYRLLGGPLYVYGTIAVLAIFNASRMRHENTLADLEAEKVELDELRGGIRERIRLQRADLLRRVQMALEPAVQQIQSELENSSKTVSAKLTDLVDTVVRPLSRDIGSNSQFDDQVSQISRRASGAYSKSRFPSRLSAGAMIVPEIAFFGTASIAIASNVITFPGAVLLTSVLSLVVIFLSYKFFQKLLLNVWVPFLVAFLISISVAVISGVIANTALGLLGYQLSPTLYIQSISAQVVITLVSFYMQFLRTQRRDAEREMTNVVSDLAIMNSQLRQEVWLNRRRIASILHGSVQSALYASAIRLAKTDTPTPEEVAAVQADISAAINKLESTEGAENFGEVLEQIKTVWDGAVEIELPIIGVEIQEKLDANPVASACAAEVVREAVSNAAKHGKAEHVVIALEQTGPNLLGITVTNDGQPLGDEVVAGYGSSILDEVAFTWQLENRGGFTVLGAAIAV